MLAASRMTTMGSNAARAAAAAPPTAAPPLSINNKRRSPVASLRVAPRRAPRTLRVAARAAAGGKAYICNDCGWIYVPSVEGADFEKLDRFKCPVCSAPKRRFSPYAGAAGKGVNDLKTRKERKARLQGGAGGAGGGKEAGNRRASGEGVDSSDAGKLVAAIVGAVAVAGALYAVLNASL